MSRQWEEFRRQFCDAAGVPDPGSDPEGVAAWARANAEVLDQLLAQTHEAVGEAVEARLNEAGGTT